MSFKEVMQKDKFLLLQKIIMQIRDICETIVKTDGDLFINSWAPERIGYAKFYSESLENSINDISKGENSNMGKDMVNLLLKIKNLTIDLENTIFSSDTKRTKAIAKQILSNLDNEEFKLCLQDNNCDK